MDKQARPDQEYVPLGRISGIHGVKGWVKVHSYTQPREAILEYQTWLLGDGRRETEPEQGRLQGKTLVVKLPGIDDREQARQLIGREIAVRRASLPALEDGAFYWADLIGLEVADSSGATLGKVERILETGANDVLVVRGEREHLIPWVTGRYILHVDLEKGCVEVDWDPEF